MGKYNYLSQHVAQDMACWVVATIEQLDTHVGWSAKVCTKRDGDDAVTSEVLLEHYFCSYEMFLDLIRHRVIAKVRKARNSTRVSNDDLKTLRDKIQQYAPMLGPPDDEDEEELRHYWYEAVVDGFSGNRVRWSLKLWGYKYETETMVTERNAFHIITDRLDARIRLLNDWTATDEATRALRHILGSSNTLRPARKDLEHEISRLSALADASTSSSCRAIFPLLERVLAEAASNRGWKPAKNLDLQISRFENEGLLSRGTVQSLRLVSKPFRDAFEHGATLEPHVAKVVLVSTLDVLARIAYDLDRK